jgi:hypothetical protein
MIPDRYMGFLEIVAQCRSISERRTLLRVLCRDKKFIKAVRLICANTVKNRVSLSTADKRRLRNHAKTIAYVARSSRGGTRRIVQNGGGFLSVLFPIVASLVGAAINGANAKMGDGTR